MEETLGPLDSPEDAQRWLRTVVTWAASGLVPGTVAQACASLVREWLKANELVLDRQQIRALEQRVRELEAELSQREREPLRAVP